MYSCTLRQLSAWRGFSYLVLLYLMTSAGCLPVEPKTDEPTFLETIRPIGTVVESRGYPFEEYSVTTEDDYILTLHRVKHGKGGKEANKKPVLVQHGLLDSSANFLATTNGMAYYLADAGYDVWLGNSRGNMFSRKHASKDPDTDPSYWDFSFHEMGLLDVPANVKKIQEITGTDKLHYVGFSMGGTEFLVLASTQPEWVLERVDQVILITPVARPQHTSAFSGWINEEMNWAFVAMMKRYGIVELLGHQEDASATVHTLCAPANTWTRRICERFVRWILSANDELHDFDNSLDVVHYMPAGSSLKTYTHFLQMGTAGKFQQYQNGRSSPPKYELAKITKRLHLICGGADKISAKKDIEWLRDQLPDAVLYSDGFQDFTHHDFLYRVDLDTTLYKLLNEILRQEEQTGPKQMDL